MTDGKAPPAPPRGVGAPALRFDRNEVSGSFGDIGTDLPLLVGMILAVDLDVASVCVMFGLLQIVTGLLYRLPMPMQPLKAIAVLVITQQVAAPVLFGAGLAIGVVMLGLALTGMLEVLARVIPRPVVRGIQFGLGLALARLALSDYVPSGGTFGYVLALVGFAIMAVLWGNRRIPPGLVVIGLGVAAALAAVDVGAIRDGIALAAPTLHRPAVEDVLTGFLVLSLPQLPLSLANSVIATQQTVADLFPERRLRVRTIGVTYGAINVVVPFLSGVPVCHGSGGLAGHYALGARTGGSVILYGMLYLALGLFFSGAFEEVVRLFPLPLLGVVLLFEALTLLLFIKDQVAVGRDLTIALTVAAMAFALPHGYLVAAVAGTMLYYGSDRLGPGWVGRDG